MRRAKARKGLSDYIGRGEHQFDGSLMDKSDVFMTIGIDKLRPGRYQSRQHFPEEHLAELAESIKAVGMIQPIVVRSVSGATPYEILAGEVRWRAAQRAQLHDVPIIVREADEHTAAAITLIENLQRRDLNPMEEAQGIQRLKGEFDLTQAEVAEALGKSQSSISRILGLLSLTPKVQAFIRSGELEAGHAKVLQGLRADAQQTLATCAVDKGWSVRELERQKQRLLQHTQSTARPSGKPNPNIVHLEQHLQTQLKTAVRFHYNERKGHGKIEIPFSSLEECNGVLERLGMLPGED